MKWRIFYLFLMIGFPVWAQTDKRGTIIVKKPACIFEKGSTTVYEKVDDMPVFPGGVYALNTWMNDNLVYPEGARRAGITAKILVSFIVMPDGSFADTRIVQGSEKEFESETMRLILKMPKWRPGKCNGIVVPVRITMPVKFNLK